MFLYNQQFKENGAYFFQRKCCIIRPVKEFFCMQHPVKEIFCMQPPSKENFVYNALWKKIWYTTPLGIIFFCFGGGHCFQKFISKGVVYQIFFQRALYTKFSFEGRCIQKNALTGCCMQNFVGLYNIFSERITLHIFLIVRCIKKILWKSIVYKII